MTLSNLGAVTVPAKMGGYLERMDFVLGMQSETHNGCGVISYGGKIAVSFTRNITEATVERLFFTKLIKLGIPVKIESNHKIQ